jgi:hypothetical protein
MPAPTALIRTPEELAAATIVPVPAQGNFSHPKVPEKAELT